MKNVLAVIVGVSLGILAFVTASHFCPYLQKKLEQLPCHKKAACNCCCGEACDCCGCCSKCKKCDSCCPVPQPDAQVEPMTSVPESEIPDLFPIPLSKETTP